MFEVPSAPGPGRIRLLGDLVTGFLRRLLDLHLEVVDEIEGELSYAGAREAGSR